jgi:cysteinyl-tRNA synthetase
MGKASGIFLLLLGFLTVYSCKKQYDVDFRREMREFVIEISKYAKGQKPNFIIIPQNGIELITGSGESHTALKTDYLNAIDGVGQEDLFYGYASDNQPTASSESDYLTAFLNRCEQNSVEVLVTDYCSTHSYVDDSYVQSQSMDYISFAAPDRELNTIPDYPVNPHNMNIDDVESLDQAKNFLYLLNPEKYATKDDMLYDLRYTNFDVLIIDAFFDGEILTKNDLVSIKEKDNDGERLVIAYMSIGEAEDYRYYWSQTWNNNPPEWLTEENPDWEGNYKVEYWHDGWKNIIYGSVNAYLDRILDAGFDGVYLDIIDAYEYFE